MFKRESMKNTYETPVVHKLIKVQFIMNVIG